jgi:hypothetical protein
MTGQWIVPDMVRYDLNKTARMVATGALSKSERGKNILLDQ